MDFQESDLFFRTPEVVPHVSGTHGHRMYNKSRFCLLNVMRCLIGIIITAI